ncbi:MAG: FAD-binding protein [Pirellulaceae bacterium]|nr:FAD-binding protein [Pirellulaceae bacterium]
MKRPKRICRRQFLTRSVALSSFGYWVGSGMVSASDALEFNTEALRRLSQKLRGRLVLPSDVHYESAKRVFYWNPTTQRQPIAIVQCGHEDDVLRGIQFARDHQLEVAVRGGGHSYLAWGNSSGLVIDLSSLKQITIDPHRRVVRAQAGMLAGEVARSAGKHGLAPVLGQCPGVGAVGVTLGGGLGWLSGLYGACCDNLISATIANAGAQKMEACQESDPDLLWAMRGAGANFGVTTRFEARLFPIESVVGGDIHFAVANARNVLRGFSDLMRQAPDGFQANLNLTQGAPGVFISFCHVGTDAASQNMLDKICSIAKAIKVAVKRQPFATLADKAAATSPANVPVPSYRAIQTVYHPSITEEAIDILVDQLNSATPDIVFGLSHYMHGAVCQVSPTDTAFPHRQEHSIHIRAAYSWSDPQESDQRYAWGQQWLQLMRPKRNESLYANFQTYETAVGSPSLFGPNYERLLQLKRKHDPDNFFRRNANIALARG